MPDRGRPGWRGLLRWSASGSGARIVVALVAPVLVGVSITDLDQGLVVLTVIYLLTWVGTTWARSESR